MVRRYGGSRYSYPSLTGYSVIGPTGPRGRICTGNCPRLTAVLTRAARGSSSQTMYPFTGSDSGSRIRVISRFMTMEIVQWHCRGEVGEPSSLTVGTGLTPRGGVSWWGGCPIVFLSTAVPRPTAGAAPHPAVLAASTIQSYRSSDTPGGVRLSPRAVLFRPRCKG